MPQKRFIDIRSDSKNKETNRGRESFNNTKDFLCVVYCDVSADRNIAHTVTIGKEDKVENWFVGVVEKQNRSQYADKVAASLARSQLFFDMGGCFVHVV